MFGVVQHLVRGADERVRRRAVVRKSRHPQRDGDGAEVLILVLERQFIDRLADVFRALRGDLQGSLGKKHREFLSADATRDIALANIGLQYEAEASQHHVARAVTEGVVDALEVIDVQQDYRERLGLAFGSRQLAAEGILQKTPVVQPGERIPDRLFLQGLAQIEIGKRKSDLFRNGCGEIQAGFY